MCTVIHSPVFQQTFIEEEDYIISPKSVCLGGWIKYSSKF